MNLLTNLLHIIGAGAVAYITARSLRDPLTRPDVLAGFQLAEAGAVPFLTTLKERAIAEGNNWLSDRLARHAEDEERHARIFTHALQQMGKSVIEVKEIRQPVSEEERRQRSPFFAAYFAGYTPEQLKSDRIDWLTFFGSTYILEFDASKDFLRMAQALPEDDLTCRNLKKGLASIAADETRHAAYLRAALERHLSPLKAQEVIDDWRDRKTNAMLAMASNLLQKDGKIPSLARDGAPVDVDAQASAPVAA